MIKAMFFDLDGTLLGKREKEEEKKGGAIQGTCAGYAVRPLGRQDVDAILRLYSGNPQFFEAMSSPATRESVLGDLTTLPPGKTAEDKHFLGFYDGETLIAVMDWVDGYPDRRTAFIGLFMVEAAYQGRGVGSAIVRDGLERMARAGFQRARLGYVETNGQSEAFWRKNSFAPTGERAEQEKYTIVVAQRNLRG
ncbi:MAG: GNAT family N-acetyltransferase [Clostridia bacterium]|nr:GNAT family N-acetyltransferase [Clostridia bacterium]